MPLSRNFSNTVAFLRPATAVVVKAHDASSWELSSEGTLLEPAENFVITSTMTCRLERADWSVTAMHF